MSIRLAKKPRTVHRRPEPRMVSMPEQTSETDAARKAFYVTTPIYYVTAAPSIGSAYTTVAADVIARWHRQRGESTWFLTGTDEHGQKVMQAAEAHDTDPREWTKRLVESEWKPVLDVIDASNDDFIRTTDSHHVDRVQQFWQRLYDAGEVYHGEYEGPYCVACEEFKLDGELLEGENGEKLRSEEHTSELQSRGHLVCRLLLE